MTKEKYNLFFDNRIEVFGDLCVLFPQDYLCAKNSRNGKIIITKNTYAIHHFNGSWVDRNVKFKLFVRKWLNRIFGEKVVEKFFVLKNTYFRKLIN